MCIQLIWLRRLLRYCGRVVVVVYDSLTYLIIQKLLYFLIIYGISISHCGRFVLFF